MRSCAGIACSWSMTCSPRVARRPPARSWFAITTRGSWGARSVILSVTETNVGAAAFYERLGFVDTGDGHRLREGSDLTVRVMSRAP